jgi:dTDP-4-dehydrorhamnose reductase
MKVLVTGVKGQLGYDVCKHLNTLNIENKGIDLIDADITNQKQITDYIVNYNPTHVIHCAAYTAVDNAEDNPDLCYKINVTGTKYIAEACKKINATMMYFSTDYVFKGTGVDFYSENDDIAPTSVYGETKYLGEQAVRDTVDNHFILRISWVYGINGKNFVKTMLKLAETYDKLTVVDDQIGSPTYTDDVASLVCKMIKTDKYGTYHATNDDICSWYQFAKTIFEYSNIEIEVNPTTSDNYPTKAKRPQNSRLSKQKLIDNGFEMLPSWKNALKRYLVELKTNKE